MSDKKYMAKVTELLIRQLTLEDTCPKCGKATATDWGGFDDRVSPETVMNASFGCCGIEWQRDMTIKFEFGARRDEEHTEPSDMCPDCGAEGSGVVCWNCGWEKDE